MKGDLDDQLDQYAITQQVAREARQANDEIKRVEAERDAALLKLGRERRQAFLDGALASRWVKPDKDRDYTTCCEELADLYAKQEPAK
jgi:hypothetical protein